MQVRDRLIRVAGVLAAMLYVPLAVAFLVLVGSMAIAMMFIGSTGAEYQAHTAGKIPRIVHFLPGAYLSSSLVAIGLAASSESRIWPRPVVLAGLVGGLVTFAFPAVSTAVYTFFLPVVGLWAKLLLRH